MDPFTVIALFNRGNLKDSTRISLCTGYKQVFDIEADLPSDFEGIPMYNYNAYCFYRYAKDSQREPECFDILWNLFDSAIHYADTNQDKERFEAYFEEALKLKLIGIPKLTIGLFHIRPDVYLNLDRKNTNLLKTKFGLEVDELSGPEYLDFCADVKNRLVLTDFCSTFAEFSSLADVYIDGNGSKPGKEKISYWPSRDEYDPELSCDNWIEFLSTDRNLHPKAFQMLKVMSAIGGEATCKKLGEKMNVSSSACNRWGTSFGERAKKYFNLPACMEGDEERFFPVPFVGRRLDGGDSQLYSWKMRDSLKEAIDNMGDEIIEKYDVTDVPKNLILYGPPGTGKTYNTVIYAVAIIENSSFEDIKEEDYSYVLDRYNKYKSEGLIEFTTFHQAYGYEEFIEGIRPVMDSSEEDHGDIQYRIEPGLFKRFCEKAGRPILKEVEQDIGTNSAPTIWKISLQGTGVNPTRTECMENDHIRVGYDSYGEDISNVVDYVDGGRNVLNAFINNMKIGDLVLSCYTASTIDAVGVITGDYEWHDEYPEYKRLRKVKWLVKGINENILDINNGASLSLASAYKLNNMVVSDVMDIVSRYSDTEKLEEKKRNYVFVIDEINRGNISKIFGELITLIEPTKRLGQPEALKAKLPYSQQPFGVPDNVYIIGTMNTADRSIAAIDTALRRRFSFKEMLPDTSVLDGVLVEGVSIRDMLDKMNRRICVLFDREHTLGHAFFTSLLDENNRNIETLARIFEDSIIPLLQEYFYEDYEKIRLVLGDNSKQNTAEQFIEVIQNDYEELFGNVDLELDDTCSYEVNADAFLNIESYRNI